MALYNVLTIVKSSTYATSPDYAKAQALFALDSGREVAALTSQAAVLASLDETERDSTAAIVVAGHFQFVFPVDAVDDDQQTAMDTARAIIEAAGGRVLFREEVA